MPLLFLLLGNFSRAALYVLRDEIVQITTQSTCRKGPPGLDLMAAADTHDGAWLKGVTGRSVLDIIKKTPCHS